MVNHDRDILLGISSQHVGTVAASFGREFGDRMATLQ
jgi:hypothetical protein